MFFIKNNTPKTESVIVGEYLRKINLAEKQVFSVGLSDFVKKNLNSKILRI